MGQVVMAAIQTLCARMLSRTGGSKDVLNLWTRGLLNKLDNLKFLAYIGADGYPTIIPVIQAQAASAEQIIFSTGVYKQDLEAIPNNTAVALFGMSLDMEDVLVRGQFQGIRRIGGVRCGSVQANWVYSPMPPKPQQIYPQVALEATSAF